MHAEKCLREKQLALMRERNLYLEKCRQIEDFGETQEWGGEENMLLSDSADKLQGSIEDLKKAQSDDQKLLQEVYDILYNEK